MRSEKLVLSLLAWGRISKQVPRRSSAEAQLVRNGGGSRWELLGSVGMLAAH